MKKYNSIVQIIEFEDEGKRSVNISFVTPDHLEHEITIDADHFFASNYNIPAEYCVHPACCEHPKGCPEETNTERKLREYNEQV